MKRLDSICHIFWNAGILCLFLFVLSVNAYSQDAPPWQSTLENNFDVVSTFDDLADWKGLSGAGNDYNPQHMPKKTDGTKSIWMGYANYGKEVQQTWIGNHGNEYVWKSSKSLRMRYGLPVGTGPTRLSTYVGTGTPDSGYKKIHVFFMIKFHQGFYVMKDPPNSDKFAYCPVHKFLLISPGFRAVNEWGSVEDQSSACNYEQVKHEYGVQGTLFNIIGNNDASSLVIKENTAIANDGPCWYYNSYIQDFKWLNTKFGQEYLAGQWIGMEFALDTGTIDKSDGTTEIWIYNEAGVVVDHQLKDNYQKLHRFDTKYNKIEIGGNRMNMAYEGCSQENRMYIDDFIVHGSRIGLDYFQLLKGGIPPSVPSASPKIDG